MAFNIVLCAYAIIGHIRADQLLPQLLMEQFDTFPIQCRHIRHMHEGVWFRKINFWQNDSSENLDNFSLIRCLYMHRWCHHGLINSYHSFWWSNLILCLYNVDTFNICMKKFGLEKIFLTKWQLWELRQFSRIRLLYMHRWCLHGPINSYHSFWWNNLRLCLYNLNTLNICMKEFCSEKIIFDETFFPLLGFCIFLYMHRWCLHGLINSYYSFWWNNLILCRYNADTLNIWRSLVHKK